MQKEDNCLAADPWRFDLGKLRRDALTCRGLSTLRNANNLIINETMKEKVNKILKELPTENRKPDLYLKRIGASKFAESGQVDHNETEEGSTIFTSMVRQLCNKDKKNVYDCFLKTGLNDRAFKAHFRGEGSIDDGGPLRESFDFACLEL
jgi:hypothetical protein